MVRKWVQLKRCVYCVWVLQRGHSGDEFDLASALCKYNLRKADLFVLSWERVRERGSISSELLMCGGGVRSILLLPLVARCQETIDVFICCMLFPLHTSHFTDLVILKQHASDKHMFGQWLHLTSSPQEYW